MSRLGDTALRYALEELRAGASEQGGNNQGPFVEKYLNAQHPERITHRGQPWCAAFWSWCWLQAAHELGEQLPVPYSRSCSVLRVHFQALGLLRPPQGDDRPVQAGDAAFWDRDGDGNPDHVNMVYELRSGELVTIGGNEGSEASGAPVHIRSRGRLSSLSTLLGFGLMYPEARR